MLFQNINSEMNCTPIDSNHRWNWNGRNFYNGDSYLPDEYRLGMLLRKPQTKIKVLVADNLGTRFEYNNALQVAANENFIAFPRCRIITITNTSFYRF